MKKMRRRRIHSKRCSCCNGGKYHDTGQHQSLHIYTWLGKRRARTGREREGRETNQPDMLLDLLCVVRKRGGGVVCFVLMIVECGFAVLRDGCVRMIRNVREFGGGGRGLYIPSSSIPLKITSFFFFSSSCCPSSAGWWNGWMCIHRATTYRIARTVYYCTYILANRHQADHQEEEVGGGRSAGSHIHTLVSLLCSALLSWLAVAWGSQAALS